ncbi:hypothetical protein [Streptomyces sp. NPDC051569]|uniref:hypothetical protein n=1 Tax=Streptomyces sp. NPDC051569 TaxID=3365661 RepID=UPI003797B840
MTDVLLSGLGHVLYLMDELWYRVRPDAKAADQRIEAALRHALRGLASHIDPADRLPADEEGRDTQTAWVDHEWESLVDRLTAGGGRDGAPPPGG